MYCFFPPYSLKDGGGGSKRKVCLFLGFCSILVEGEGFVLRECQSVFILKYNKQNLVSLMYP